MGDLGHPSAADLLRPLAGERQVLLQTRKHDGAVVGTPVSLAVEDDHAFFRTWSTSGKAKRLRNYSNVAFAPCARNGRVDGEWLYGRATLLSGDDDRHARALIERKHPIFQRLLVRTAHRLRGYQTQHYRIDEVHA